MVLSVLYVWCQLNKETIVQFWFGTQFKAMYLPWVLFLFNMILSGGGMAELIGILVGHLYYFMKIQYPTEYGGQPLLSTPAFVENWFPRRVGGIGGVNAAPQAARAQPQPRAGGGGGGGGGHNWGRGNTLGGNN